VQKVIFGILPGCGIIQYSWRVVILEGLELARKAVDAASEKLATNIVLLDVREKCSFADYFVICSDIEKSLKDEGENAHHQEGSLESGWYLLDYSDVIVHVFGVKEREYYALEELWSAAKVLLRIQ
jgi:ribosome-associated protein